MPPPLQLPTQVLPDILHHRLQYKLYNLLLHVLPQAQVPWQARFPVRVILYSYLPQASYYNPDVLADDCQSASILPNLPSENILNLQELHNALDMHVLYSVQNDLYLLFEDFSDQYSSLHNRVTSASLCKTAILPGVLTGRQITFSKSLPLTLLLFVHSSFLSSSFIFQPC